MKRSEQLREAYGYYVISQTHGFNTESERGSAAKRLALFGFDVVFISRILNTSIFWTANITGNVVPRPPFNRFDPKTVDSMALLAVQYELSGAVNGPLARMVVTHGTGVRDIGRYTLIPLDYLRKVINE